MASDCYLGLHALDECFLCDKTGCPNNYYAMKHLLKLASEIKIQDKVILT
jgi:hypothetical protein